MNFILAFGAILIISALSCKMTGKMGVPLLVGFILIGILIGNWYRMENLSTVGNICDLSLLLIIFTGGFLTSFSEARPVLPVASVLSVAGTMMTAVIASAFAYFALHLDFYQAMILGAIISPTDAASVFSVLSSKQMDLRNSLGPMLEIESGSNDPFAYMMTVMYISMATGGSQNVALLLVSQIIIGVLSGYVFYRFGRFVINKLNVDIDGLYAVLLCGTAFLMYGAAAQFGGNGFLAAYIGGILIGNSKIVYKRFLSRMFSAISTLMQILLFIVLGILCMPSSMAAVTVSGLVFAFFLLLVARPLVMFALMKPFRRRLNEIALVSWSGFRGASSVVFATLALRSGLPYAEYIFSIVFFVCMLSVTLQGSLIAPIARKLKLIEE